MKTIKGAIECSTCPKDMPPVPLDWTKERKQTALVYVAAMQSGQKPYEVPFSCSLCQTLAVAELFARRALARFDEL